MSIKKRITQLEDKQQLSEPDIHSVRWEDIMRRDFASDEDMARAARILQQLMDLGTHPDTVTPDEWQAMIDEDETGDN